MKPPPYPTALGAWLLAASSAACLAWPAAAAAQETGTITVRVVAPATPATPATPTTPGLPAVPATPVAPVSPVEGARVSAGAIASHTDVAGQAVLRLAGGDHTVRVTAAGFRAASVRGRIRAGADTLVVVELEPDVHEGEEIIVASTRRERRIEDEPIRIEVMGREEVEEKLLMTPGDIAMLLNEAPGLRVQPTSPALGGAGVRIQGLRGRYTQILGDGLPIHGGQTGALGPLQIPPMDLAQVEVIKGAASALYGASALGGVVNLISRRPADTNERELLLNQSTLGGTDVILWNSGPLTETLGYTLLGGAHRQAAKDVDDDGWADVPMFRRASLRPRVFWNSGRGATAMITMGAMLEEREGGTVAGGTVAGGSVGGGSVGGGSVGGGSVGGGATQGGTSYVESLATSRLDGGLVVRLLVGDDMLLSVRGSAAGQRHDHRFGAVPEGDEHRTAFAEAALAGSLGRHGWVAGLAFQHDDYTIDDVAGFDYTHSAPGLFAQADFLPGDRLSLSLSGRLDRHSVYGTFLSPRVSTLFRPAEDWTVRASAGAGYFAPTPWTDETEAIGLHRVRPPAALEAERGRTASIDVSRTLGHLELNATAFAARIIDPVQVRPTADGRLELFNAARPVLTRGTELLARFHAEGLHVTASHVFLDASEQDPAGTGRREVPLTPRHTAGIVAAREQEGRGRYAVEFYYTGRQQLDDNPYRIRSEPHVIVGFLVERRFGPARVFLNAENIFDTRQTRHDSLLLPARSPLGRWTTDVWAPLEGRAFNGGIRWEF
jgi:outer membrane receptor for ferrienterochelin and colicins